MTYPVQQYGSAVWYSSMVQQYGTAVCTIPNTQKWTKASKNLSTTFQPPLKVRVSRYVTYIFILSYSYIRQPKAPVACKTYRCVILKGKSARRLNHISRETCTSSLEHSAVLALGIQTIGQRSTGYCNGRYTCEWQVYLRRAGRHGKVFRIVEAC